MKAIDDLTSAIPVLGPNGETLGPHLDRELWKSVRGPLIGSSDSPAIIGRNEWSGPWDVYDRIVLGEWGDDDEEGSEPNADIRRGNRQEANALARFREVHGLATERAGMLAHPDDDRIVCDVDALIPVPFDCWPEQILSSPLWQVVTELGGPGWCEAKVPRTAKFYRVKAEGLPADWLVQGQHHGMVTGLRWGVFVLFCPEYDDVVAFPVVTDVEWGAWLLRTLQNWHDRHIARLQRPKRPTPAPPRWPTKVPGEAVLVETDAWMQAATILTRCHYELEEALSAKAEAEAELLKVVAEIDAQRPEGQDPAPFLSGGGVSVKRRSTSSQNRLDTRALLAELKLAQIQTDAEKLLQLDPKDFRFQTRSSDKVDIGVFGPNPLSIGAGIDQAPGGRS